MLIPPDWSQFLPDLVNALITGGVVALVFWRLQLRRDTRIAEQGVLDDWERLRPHLRRLFQAERLKLLPTDFDSSTPAADLREALERHPLEHWIRQLPKNREILALGELERNWPLLVDDQYRLKSLLPSASRTERPPGVRLQDFLDDVVVGLVPARLSGARLEEQGSYLVLREHLDHETISVWLDRMVARPDVAPAAARVLARFEAIDAAYQTVRAAVLR